MKTFFVYITLIFGLLSFTQVKADVSVPLSGSISTANGTWVIGNGSFGSPSDYAQLNWNVTQINTSTWQYVYSLTGSPGGFQNLDGYFGIQAANPTAYTITSSNTNGFAPEQLSSFQFFEFIVPSSSDVGIVFNSNNPTVSFTTPYAPVLGDIAYDGGVSGSLSGGLTLYNAGFGQTPTNNSDWIAVPGSIMTPEPTLYAALALLLIAVFTMSKKQSHRPIVD